jgi:hypothetical protein
MTNKKERDEAQDLAKAIHEDKCATINGRDYVITQLTHIKRRKVFAYFTHIQRALGRGDLWFLETPEWADVEKTICGVVTFEDNLLSKRPQHWDEYPEDFILFIQSMLPAISYPFLKGLSGD